MTPGPWGAQGFAELLRPGVLLWELSLIRSSFRKYPQGSAHPTPMLRPVLTSASCISLTESLTSLPNWAGSWSHQTSPQFCQGWGGERG